MPLLTESRPSIDMQHYLSLGMLSPERNGPAATRIFFSTDIPLVDKGVAVSRVSPSMVAVISLLYQCCGESHVGCPLAQFSLAQLSLDLVCACPRAWFSTNILLVLRCLLNRLHKPSGKTPSCVGPRTHLCVVSFDFEVGS